MAFPVVFILFQLTFAMCVTAKKLPSNDNTTLPMTEEMRNQTCSLPKDTGRGRARFPRFFFDSNATKTCMEFIFGGGGGNLNNFESLEECQEMCVKPLSTNDAEILQGFPTGLPTTTKKIGKKNKICFLPKETGPSRAAFPRFYFNSEKGKCMEFTYGGTGGNENNFETKEECEKECADSAENQATTMQPSQPTEPPTQQPMKPSTMPDKICFLPKKIGKGRAAFPRFYFNSIKRKCLKFIYGGTGGNENNFETMEECEKVCADSAENQATTTKPLQPTELPMKPPTKPDKTCFLPRKIGKGKAIMKRFYFNSEKKKCVPFFYGGVGGNANNFATKKKCEQVCGGNLTTMP